MRDHALEDHLLIIVVDHLLFPKASMLFSTRFISLCRQPLVQFLGDVCGLLEAMLLQKAEPVALVALVFLSKLLQPLLQHWLSYRKLSRPHAKVSGILRQ